jgi:hypothetical protein
MGAWSDKGLCFIESCFEATMTVVKSASDGLRDCKSETQLNLNRPLRISPLQILIFVSVRTIKG